jgi:hypothetical protein
VIRLKNLCLAGIAFVTVEESGDHQTLMFRKLDAALKSDKVQYDFRNLVKAELVLHLSSFVLYLGEEI